MKNFPLSITSFLLMVVFTINTLGAMTNDSIKSSSDKVNVNYLQRHSSLVLSNINDLSKDAIRIRKNLTMPDDMTYDYSLLGDIPANELYQGSWEHNRVHIYNELQNKPDTFLVDLKTFHMPVKEGSYITSKFGSRGSRMHLGTDLKVQIGDTIYAAFEGKVRVRSYEKKGYGKYLVLRHPNGLETIYGHLSDYLVVVDQDVKAGEPIGLGGNTGRSTGPHLHFETRFIGQPINPADIVDFQGYKLIKDQYLVTPSAFKTYTSYKSIKFHTVTKGDTLSKIARRYGTSIATLCRLNKITSKSTLRIGHKLRVN